MSQSYSNHTRLVPAFHFVLLPVCLVSLILAVINMFSSFEAFTSGKCSSYSAGCIANALFPLFIALGLTLVTVCTRNFAKAVQDRTILAEENFRHFRLTGNVLDSRLSKSQIIALRFASDEEFVALASNAISENLSSEDIKKTIRNWRVDNNRC
jgi:Family of unknown function (DUF6526)